MIKTFPVRGFSAEFDWLQARVAEDPRITLITETMSRNEVTSLYGCCDVFLSLHRSEGFGRGIAEALQLGLDVIATDFGGNTDFCTGPLAHAVRWHEVPIPLGSYPFADGQTWAEPDLDHAVELCLKVAARRSKNYSGRSSIFPERDLFALNDYRNQFSFASVGSMYRERLDELWENRGNLPLKDYLN